MLFRTLDGTPAWVHGINHQALAVVDYTLALLQQVTLCHPIDFSARLQQSLAALTPVARQESLTRLRQAGLRAPSANPVLIDTLCATIRTSSAADFLRQLETWQKNLVYAQSLTAYCQTMLAINDQRKRLIKLTNTEQVLAMFNALHRYCLSINRPVYCIHSPDDLVCSAPFIARTGDIGIMQPGPGGRLHDFLSQLVDKSNPPVLLLNYHAFAADDIVRFNSLLNDIRSIDGTTLSKHMLVVGVININKPGCYQGNDFYSRFDTAEQYDMPAAALKQSLCSLPNNTSQAPTARTVINLAHRQDWQERLLGRWLLQKDVLQFEDDELSRALAYQLPIELQNALWDNPRFQAFWQQALTAGVVYHAGRTITMPPPDQWYQSDGYYWPALIPHLHLVAGLTSNAIILNPHRLTTFFRQYQFHNHDQMLTCGAGWLSQHQGKRLTVNLTRALNEDEWGLLLDECRQHKVVLEVHVAPGVTLPAAITALVGDSYQTPLVYQAWEHTSVANPLVIASADPATTIAQLVGLSEKNPQIIDISECTIADLLLTTSATFQAKDRTFRDVERLAKSYITAQPSNHLKSTVAVTLTQQQVQQLLINIAHYIQYKTWYSPEFFANKSQKKSLPKGARYQLALIHHAQKTGEFCQALADVIAVAKQHTSNRLVWQQYCRLFAGDITVVQQNFVAFEPMEDVLRDYVP